MNLNSVPIHPNQPSLAWWGDYHFESDLCSPFSSMLIFQLFLSRKHSCWWGVDYSDEIWYFPSLVWKVWRDILIWGHQILRVWQKLGSVPGIQLCLINLFKWINEFSFVTLAFRSIELWGQFWQIVSRSCYIRIFYGTYSLNFQCLKTSKIGIGCIIGG
jgi:hypothetical protein